MRPNSIPSRLPVFHPIGRSGGVREPGSKRTAYCCQIRPPVTFSPLPESPGLTHRPMILILVDPRRDEEISVEQVIELLRSEYDLTVTEEDAFAAQRRERREIARMLNFNEDQVNRIIASIDNKEAALGPSKEILVIDGDTQWYGDMRRTSVCLKTTGHPSNSQIDKLVALLSAAQIGIVRTADIGTI